MKFSQQFIKESHNHPSEIKSVIILYITAPIDFQTDVADVAKAISSLPVFDSTAESVSVTAATTVTQGIKYTVTFVTERGKEYGIN